MNNVPGNHRFRHQDRRRTHGCILTVMCAGILLCLSSCSPGPAEYQVRDAISAYFQEGGLHVVRLEIRTIEREPIGARQYMGPKRYRVSVPLITLQSTTPGSSPRDYKNVTITIRINASSRYGVSIDDAGISPW